MATTMVTTATGPPRGAISSELGTIPLHYTFHLHQQNSENPYLQLSMIIGDVIYFLCIILWVQGMRCIQIWTLRTHLTSERSL